MMINWLFELFAFVNRGRPLQAAQRKGITFEMLLTPLGSIIEHSHTQLLIHSR